MQELQESDSAITIVDGRREVAEQRKGIGHLRIDHARPAKGR